jgi:hypothetical protein
LAYGLRARCAARGFSLRLGYAQQILAASLGYGSLAAYQSSPEESPTLDAAAHLFVDSEAAFDRAKQLSLNPPPFLPGEVIETFRELLPRAVLHASPGDLDGAVRSFVDNYVVNHEETAGQLALINGYGLDEVYLPIDDIDLSSLPPPGQVEAIAIEGHVSLELDDERPYSGHKVEIEATLTIERVTRQGISAPGCHIDSAKLDWNW